MIQRPDSTPRRRTRRDFRPGPWIAIIAVGAAVRLLTAALGGLSTALRPDPRLAEAAEHVARGAGIALGASGDAVATASVPPLPPILLAAWTGLIGGRGGADVWLAVALGALLPLVVGQLAATLHGPTVGRLAAWTAALDPLLLSGTGLVQEQAFAFVLTASLVLTANWLRTPRMGRAVGSGAAWGLCALCWTPGLAIMAAAIAWAWSPLGLVAGARDRLRHLTALGVGAACVLVPWAARNALILHAVAPVTTSSGMAFLSGNNKDVWGSPRRRGGSIDVLAVEPYASHLTHPTGRVASSTPTPGRVASSTPTPGRVASSTTAPEHEALDGPPSEAARDARAWSEGLGFLKTVKTREALGTARDRLLRLWSPRLLPDDPVATLPRRGAVESVIAFLEVVLGSAAAWGLVRALSGARRWFQSLPALVLAIMSAGTILFYGSSRTRLGIEPLVALLAALGIQDARRRFHLQRAGLRLVRRKASGQRA